MRQTKCNVVVVVVVVFRLLPHLSESLSVGAHVREDDEDVLLALVGQVLGGRQRQTRGDDALDADWWKRKEKSGKS